MRNNLLYLKNIYEAMDATQAFVTGMDFNTFVVDDKTNSAVIRKLEIIGKSMKNVPDAIQEKYTEVPWLQIAEMSDCLVYRYYDIDYTLVWDTVKDLIPPLQPIIMQILEDMEE